MNRNALYLILGALAAAIVILGYLYYQEQQKSGIEINIGKGGLSIEEK
jgi:predicted negative regulator of RcsB-dependent stress response